MTNSPTNNTPLRIATFNVGLGLRHKLPSILQRCLKLTLDIIALQEIGDPVIVPSSLTTHTLIFSPGPSHHQAGVGLLISRDLIPRCRAYKRSTSGRLVGVVLELNRNQRMLIVSAYMPTGLDNKTTTKSDQARQLYAEILDWTIDVHQIVVMGDLNETITRFDRFPLPPPSSLPWSSSSPRPIHILQQSHFIDEYRRHHPDASIMPGYTHVIDTALVHTRSRIDYIWTRGIDSTSSHHIRIDDQHRMCTSHHHLLLMELRLIQLPVVDSPLLQLQLPNLRAATEHQRQSFITQLDRRINNHTMHAYALSDDADTLNHVASSLTTLTRDCAFATLPITGASPLKSKSALKLQHQRRDLTRLLRMTERIIADHHQPILCPSWTQQYIRCTHAHHIKWHIDLYYNNNIIEWISETQNHICSIRASIDREQHRMNKQRVHAFDVNPAAEIHRMLQSDSLPSQLFSVVDSDGALTSNATELENVMVDHFTSVFAIPPADASPLPYDPPSILFDKPSMHEEWYDSLTVDITTNELIDTISDSPLVSAPGQDEVSVGVWRIALAGSINLCTIVAALFSSCIRTSSFPSAWKSSIIIPFVKDALKERSMSNIRPISLQSCLGKLFNKILAHRLAAIIARHPILNTAQRGFITGGTTIKCIDELLDAWDWSRTTKCEQYTLFYDIKQAYDSVQSNVMLRALRRIGVPDSFVALISNSLTDLTSCIRTVYGSTRTFPVERSLRQGDPLAPLLFVILMDGLHDGLDEHPITHVQHGLRITSKGDSAYIGSLGYADDTAVITNSLPSLYAQNEWVHYFMQFNSLRLNPLKCELVGRDALGQPVSTLDINAAGIRVHNVAIVPRPHDQPIRYLGIHSCFNGDWSTQQSKSRSMIMMYTRLVSKFKMTISRAVYMFNTFVAPKLELALHYVHGTGTSKWVDACDRIIIGSIKHASSSPVHLSHTAVACALNLKLPSWLEASIKVSELYLRMNSNDPRWAHLGRILLRNERLSIINASTISSHRSNTGSRNMRAAYLAVHVLHWDIHLNHQHRIGSRHQHMLDIDSIDGLPLPSGDTDHSPSIVGIQLPQSTSMSHIVHNHWSGFGNNIDPHHVDVYTDGSYDSATSTSSWAVVIADQWFDDNYTSIPSNEHTINNSHVDGAMMIGASIKCTTGVYPAELQAIARALAMLPSSYDVHIHTDSRSSIDAIIEYEQQLNERRRMRMSSRPLLSLIHHQLDIRRRAGGVVTLSHVKAHSTNTDRDSVGNRIADYQANIARKHADRSYPLSLVELPIGECELHMRITDTDSSMAIINDCRRTAVSLMRAAAKVRWSTVYADTQGVFASSGTIELGRIVMQHGSKSQQSTFVHVATNTIHHHWPQDDHNNNHPTLQQLHCDHDGTSDLTIIHLASCPTKREYRNQLRDAIINLFEDYECTREWLHLHRRLPLHRMMMIMLPPSTSIAANAIDELYIHHAASMIGSFTNAESNAAAKRIGFDDNDGIKVMIKFRMLCLDHIELFYNKLKGIT